MKRARIFQPTALAFAGTLVVASVAATRANADTINVGVVGLRSSNGQVLVALHDNSASFPSGWPKAVRVIRVPASQLPVTATFKDVPKGRYAVIAVHDENGDGEMTKNFIGLPREGFGTSNNPSFFGPPRFGPAEFQLDGTASLRIQVVYP